MLSNIATIEVANGYKLDYNNYNWEVEDLAIDELDHYPLQGLHLAEQRDPSDRHLHAGFWWRRWRDLR